MTQKSYSSLADQNTEYLASNTARIRPQTPLYRESADVVRPFNPVTDSRIHAVAEVYQNHPQWVADSRFDNDISQEYLFSVDEGDRSIEVFEGHGPQYDVSAYPIEESVGVPISTVSDGDRVDLLSISEDCEYYDGDSPPTFENFDTAVAVVPDSGSIDGVGVAPLADISEDTPHHTIGRVDQLDGFGLKSEKRGFGESVPAEIER